LVTDCQTCEPETVPLLMSIDASPPFKTASIVRTRVTLESVELPPQPAKHRMINKATIHPAPHDIHLLSIN
jgi:hypothetical protein